MNRYYGIAKNPKDILLTIWVKEDVYDSWSTIQVRYEIISEKLLCFAIQRYK